MTGTGGSGETASTTFRLPRTAYLIAVFLLVGIISVAGGAGAGADIGTTGLVLLLALLVVPVTAAAFIARTATVVDEDGITARALLGHRTMRWAELRGVSVQGARVHAVLADGTVRLPCVQVRHLYALSEAAGDHLPELRRPPVKEPPGSRRRR